MIGADVLWLATWRARVDAHPWQALAAALALGAYVAATQPRVPRSRVVRAALAWIGGLVVRVVAEAALANEVRSSGTVAPGLHDAA